MPPAINKPASTRRFSAFLTGLPFLNRTVPVRRLVRFWMAAILFLSVVAQPLTVLAGNGELLQLIRDDAGLCIQLHNWKSAREQLLSSTWIERVKDSGLYQAWLESSDAQHLKKGIADVEKGLNRPLLPLLDELLGDQTLLAVYPNPGSKPVGVLLTKSTSSEALQKIIVAWEKADPQPVERRKHQNINYTIRNPGEKQFCFVTLGNVLAASDNEPAIQQIIELSNVPATKSDRLPDSEAFRTSQGDLNADTSFEIYLNPRMWDDVLKLDEKPKEDQAARIIAKAWKDLSSIRVGFRASPHPVWEVVVHKSSPENASELPATAQLSETLHRLPANALAIWEGTSDFPWLAKQFSRLIKNNAAEKGVQDLQRARGMVRGLLLGQDLLTEVIPQFGPGFAFCVVPRKMQTEEDVPIDGFVVIGLTEASDPEAGSLMQDGLDNALNTSLNLFAAFYNNTPRDQEAVVHTDRAQGQETRFRWIKHLAGYEPGYRLSPRQLILSGSPGLIRAFLTQSSETSTASIPMLKFAQSEYFPKYHQLFFVNIRAVRDLLRENRGEITKQAMESHSLSETEAAERLKKVNELAGFFDGAFIAATVEPSVVRIVAGALTEER